MDPLTDYFTNMSLHTHSYTSLTMTAECSIKCKCGCTLHVSQDVVLLPYG